MAHGVMRLGSQRDHNHQVNCEVLVAGVLPHIATYTKALMPSRLGPHHLAEGCKFVFTQALMNCGLCGYDESTPLLSKGTWEDNENLPFTNFSLAWAL